MTLAVDQVIADGKRVLVVTQPYMTDGHVEQQANLIAMLDRSYGNNGNVRHLNLGEVLSLDDLTYAWDGMHLTAAGNDLVATRLVSPVLSMWK